MSYSQIWNQPLVRRPVPKKSNTGLIVGIVIAVIIVVAAVVGVIIWYVIRNRTSSTSTTDGGGTGGTGTVTNRCTADADCAAGTVCFAPTGICVECISDVQCTGATPVCNTSSNECVECNIDGECGNNEVCTDHVCVSTGCTVNADCTNPSLPFCEPISGTCIECNNNIDCGPGQNCISGECVSTACTVNGDCTDPAAPLCDTGSGVCVECLGTGDCNVGDVCDNNVCVGGTCTDNVDCTNPAKPICDNNQCHECVTALDCTGNPIYNGNGQTLCDANQECVECINDNDCGIVGETCQNGICCNYTPPTILSTYQQNSNEIWIEFSIDQDYTNDVISEGGFFLAPLGDFIGECAGTTLNITTAPAQHVNIGVGTFISGTGISSCMITALGTGTGGVGTYVVSVPQNFSSRVVKPWKSVGQDTISILHNTPNRVFQIPNTLAIPGETYAVVCFIETDCAILYSDIFEYTPPTTGTPTTTSQVPGNQPPNYYHVNNTGSFSDQYLGIEITGFTTDPTTHVIFGCNAPNQSPYLFPILPLDGIKMIRIQQDLSPPLGGYGNTTYQFQLGYDSLALNGEIDDFYFTVAQLASGYASGYQTDPSAEFTITSTEF